MNMEEASEQRRYTDFIDGHQRIQTEPDLMKIGKRPASRGVKRFYQRAMNAVEQAGGEREHGLWLAKFGLSIDEIVKIATSDEILKTSK